MDLKTGTIYSLGIGEFQAAKKSYLIFWNHTYFQLCVALQSNELLDPANIHFYISVVGPILPIDK